MALTPEDTPLVLQGPRPELPPELWASPAVVIALAVGLGALTGWLVWRLSRRAPRPLAPLVVLENALRLAEAQPPAEAIRQATQALRNYLAAIDARAATSLATEELLVALAGLPVFLPARQPLAAVLRGADAAKFAGNSLEVPLLLAGVREAAQRIEAARSTFARPVVKPLVPPRPTPLVGPPPLPARTTPAGPPPLPRRDLA